VLDAKGNRNGDRGEWNKKCLILKFFSKEKIDNIFSNFAVLKEKIEGDIMSDKESRYELTELIVPEDFKKAIETFSKVLNVATGVVKNPEFGEREITINNQNDWRLIPVVGFDRKGNKVEGGSDFCKAIHSLSHGIFNCLRSDLKNAKTAFTNQYPSHYYCDCAGLIDIVTPVRVGGHHLANVYFGQIRDEEKSFDEVWDNYHGILSQSNNSNQDGKTRNELEHYYQNLRSKNELIGLQQIEEVLLHLADLISRKASRQAVIKVIDEIASELLSPFDLEKGCNIILRKISRVLNYTSGSIILEKEGKLRQVAKVYPPNVPDMIFKTDQEIGLAPYIFKHKKTVRCNNIDAMNKIVESSIVSSRQNRNIQSFLGAPLIHDSRVVGVLEIAHSEKSIYTDDDERLIELLAQYISLNIKSNRENRIFLSIARERNRDQLFKMIVNEVPKLINGTGCSIFLRQRISMKLPNDSSAILPRDDNNIRKLPAVLVETTELKRDLIGKAQYEPDFKEGLTAGVLVSGKSILIPSRENARTTALPKIYTKMGIKWKGKFNDDDVNHPKDYYKNRPFLGVPIMANDGAVLGVIRIADSTFPKKEFSSNDLTILEACASEIANTLEADSLGFFLGKNYAKLEELGTVLKNINNLPQMIQTLKELSGRFPQLNKNIHVLGTNISKKYDQRYLRQYLFLYFLINLFLFTLLIFAWGISVVKGKTFSFIIAAISIILIVWVSVILRKIKKGDNV